jgi:hypothetical protein
MGEKFNYVIGRKWSEESNSLCCYTYHTTVFYGDVKDSQKTLEFIRGKATEKADDYQIYRISDKPLNNN